MIFDVAVAAKARSNLYVPSKSRGVQIRVLAHRVPKFKKDVADWASLPSLLQILGKQDIIPLLSV